MNDFTKEELHSILEAFEWVKEDPSWRRIEGWDDKLQDKIQSMIDNYCEHPVWEVGVVGFKCMGCRRMAYDR